MGRLEMGERSTGPFFIFTVDLEPDAALSSFTAEVSHRGMEEGLPRLLELLDRHGIRATFYATAITAKAYPDAVRGLAKQGYEVGCHGYRHEFLGVPFISTSVPKVPIDRIAPDSSALLSVDEISEVIERATKVIAEIIGSNPTSFKAPWMTLHPAAYGTLEKLGYKVSTSVPVWKYGGPLLPYHPSTKSWFKEGDSKILELPTSVDPLPIVRMDYRVLHAEFSSYTLRTMGQEFLLKAAERIAAAQRMLGGPVVFVFDTVVSEYLDRPPSPHSGVWVNTGRKLVDLLDSFLSEIERRFNSRFLTATEFAEVWEREFCPKHRSSRA